jgi:hypothetical protein
MQLLVAGSDRVDAGKTTWFLKMVVGIVLTVGLIISVLSFYLLMLSIYLLLQKNTKKLENLLMIGFSPAAVARPYQVLTVALNAAVAAMGVPSAGMLWQRTVGIYVNSSLGSVSGECYQRMLLQYTGSIPDESAPSDMKG